MKRWVLVAAVVLTCGHAPGQGGRNRGDEHRFQGEWEVVDMVMRGASMRAFGEPPPQLKWDVQGDKVSLFRDGRRDLEWTFRFDETKQPKQISLTRFWGNHEACGLYQWDRDSLKIVMDCGTEGKTAPASFEAKDLLVITLKRPAGR